jgi:ubiquinone/menaquinone biosynthesis C-methylase UbiE
MLTQPQKPFGKAIKMLWSNRNHGARPLRDEMWLKKYADELLAIIPNGGTLFDVGCGACELTTYLAPQFERVYGIDFSKSMLDAARKRVNDLQVGNIELIYGTMSNIPAVGQKANVIMSYAVIQYLGAAEFREHLNRCRCILDESGLICVGLIPDLERKNAYLQRVFPSRSDLARHIYLVGRRLGHYLQNNPIWDGIGNWYSKNDIRQIAADAGFDAQVLDSRYADYRFHALLRPVPD